MTAETFSISELCKSFDVSARTLRFYESKELLAPVRDGQRRIFSTRDRARLKLILQAKRFGFALEDIRQMLDLYDIGDHQETQRAEIIRRAEDRLAVMKRQRDELEEAIGELQEHLRQGRLILGEPNAD